MSDVSTGIQNNLMEISVNKLVKKLKLIVSDGFESTFVSEINRI